MLIIIAVFSVRSTDFEWIHTTSDMSYVRVMYYVCRVISHLFLYERDYSFITAKLVSIGSQLQHQVSCTKRSHKLLTYLLAYLLTGKTLTLLLLSRSVLQAALLKLEVSVVEVADVVKTDL